MRHVRSERGGVAVEFAFSVAFFMWLCIAICDLLRFSYITADKREYVVFNKRAGLGTIRCEAPYHKRLRPTLEYAELCELVAVASRLESFYGYPLDIEFGLEGSRLWILQVRPVPMTHSLLQETMQRYPLGCAGEAVQAIRGGERHDSARTVS